MQDFLHSVLAGLDHLMSPALIANATRALLATTAAFASSRHQREAALRALRALNGQRDPDDQPRCP